MTLADFLELPDGRRLRVACERAAGGPAPHLPSRDTWCRYAVFAPLKERLMNEGMRFVTTSRPGYGDSSRHRGPGRR